MMMMMMVTMMKKTPVATSDPFSNVNHEFPNSTGSEVTTPLEVIRSSKGHNDTINITI